MKVISKVEFTMEEVEKITEFVDFLGSIDGEAWDILQRYMESRGCNATMDSAYEVLYFLQQYATSHVTNATSAAE